MRIRRFSFAPQSGRKGFFSQRAGDLDWTPSFLCPSERRALIITLQRIWKEVALVLSLLLFPWVISPPIRRGKTGVLPPTQEMGPKNQMMELLLESCLLPRSTCTTVGTVPWERRNSFKSPNPEPLFPKRKSGLLWSGAEGSNGRLQERERRGKAQTCISLEYPPRLRQLPVGFIAYLVAFDGYFSQRFDSFRIPHPFTNLLLAIS